MNNMECIVAVLTAHREARSWTDEAVAMDLVAQLDLDPVGEAKNAKPVVAPGITEDEVLAHEAAAKEAVAKATAAREALNAQAEEEDKAKVDVAEEQAKAAAAQREAALKAQTAALATQAGSPDQQRAAVLAQQTADAEKRAEQQRVAAMSDVAPQRPQTPVVG
jgi:hypothetical protein